jgi:secreted Zn-dependent insulinase-like peptidase
MFRQPNALRAAALLARAALLAAFLVPVAAGAGVVRKSESDPFAYRALVLANGLKVILASDPGTDMAAASLSVAVGSGADPRERAGLAHFLEHMLFLGTQKYPEPGEYKDFIARHGGSDNAYTAFDETNYFFEVEASWLEPTLDRFAQFFIAPLFNPEYVARERQVVHSEFLGRRDDDRRRTYSAVQQAMNADHPFATFAVGNNQTLAERDGTALRDELIAFYRRYYSANLMALAVVGREPLDTLERWVRERFSNVENRNAAGLEIEQPLFRPGSLPARLDVVPEREQYALSFSFPIPAQRDLWRSKPAGHVAHLLGHEGETSLLAELKRRGWAQGLSAGTGFDHDTGATLDVRIQLTAEGAAHTDAIAALLFNAIRVVSAKGVEEWLFQENARLAEIGFRFAERPSPPALARRLASWQQEVPQEDVLHAPYAYEQWRPDLVRDVLAHLRPDNVLVTRVAPGLETDRTSPWYEAPYRIVPIDAQTRSHWLGADPVAALDVPAPNPFVPQHLALLPPTQQARPVERLSRPGFRLWHLRDTAFGLPKANFYFSLRSPSANASPRASLLTQLYVDLVNDQLDTFSYPADLAGLSFRLYRHSRGLTVRISGYDERQPELLARILDALASPRIDPRRFEILRNELGRDLENSRLDQPYRRAMTRLHDILVEPNWTVAERLAIVDTLTAAELERFVQGLLARVEVVALAHGNVDEAGARALGDAVYQQLVARAQTVSVPRARVAGLRRGDRLAAVLPTEHPESSLVLYLQGPDRDLASRARAGLVAQVTASPFFDALRTEKELGYVVFANAMPILDTPGVVFIVQSPVADAATLQQEVQGFVAAFTDVVQQMEPATFEQHKRALVARVLEEERQLGERSDRLWHEIDRANFEFDTRERLVEAIRATSLQAFRDFYSSVAAGEARRQLVVRTRGERTPRATVVPVREQVVSPIWVRENRRLLPG